MQLSAIESGRLLAISAIWAAAERESTSLILTVRSLSTIKVGEGGVSNRYDLPDIYTIAPTPSSKHTTLVFAIDERDACANGSAA